MRLAAVGLAVALATSCGGDEGPREPMYTTVLTPVSAVPGTKAFDDPAALAVTPDGDLWVANRRSSTLARYTPDQLAASGVPKAATVIEGGAIESPNGMVLDARGHLWVSMRGTHRVAGFTPADLAAGRPPSLLLPDPDRALREPAGLALDRYGNLWVANTGIGHLVRYPRRALEAGTGRPDVVVTVADDDCGAVGVHAGRIWLACATTRVYYQYAINPRSGRAPWLTKHTTCSGSSFAAPPDGSVLSLVCHREGSVASVAGRDETHKWGTGRGQVLEHATAAAYDAAGGLWVATSRNVLARFPGGDPFRRFPDVVLRPRPGAVPTVTQVQQFPH